MYQPPKYLSLEEKYAAYRPVGEHTFDEAVAMIDDALAYCKKNKIRGLLVDVTGFTGFPPPSTTQRFQFATRWSETAAGRVYLSMVAPPDLIDPERIGITMATNRGLRTEVFTTETEAWKWLRAVCP
jgi:hypothetical protein